MNPIPMPVHSQRRKLNQELRVPSWLEDGGRARLNPRQAPPGPPRVRDSWVNVLAPVFFSSPLFVCLTGSSRRTRMARRKRKFPCLTTLFRRRITCLCSCGGFSNS